MRRRFPVLVLAAVFSLFVTSLAWADVQVNVAISPSTISQCGTGELMIALGNTGTKPILARLCFTLDRGTTTLFGPLCGRVFLAAGENRMHKFAFVVPRLVPPGDYSLSIDATGSDGTTASSTASFTVVSGTCPPTTAATGGDAILQSALTNIGATPDGTTPVQSGTWGSIKIRYR